MALLDQRCHWRLPKTVFIDDSATAAELRGLPELPYAAQIQEVRTSLSDGRKDAVLDALAQLPALNELWISGFANLTAGDFAELGQLVNLTQLRICADTMDGAGLSRLNGLNALRLLELESYKTFMDGLGALGSLPALRRLRVYGKLAPGALRGLGYLQQIEELDLMNACADDCTGLDSIAKLTKLQVLNLHASTLVPAIMPHLAALVGLRKLTLTVNKIPGSDYVHLTPLVNLEELELPGVNNDALPLLVVLTKLRRLNLDGFCLAPWVEEQLQRAIPGLTIETATMNYDP